MGVPTFSVIHTNKIAVCNKRLLVSDRTDIDMNTQRSGAHIERRYKLQDALMSDYKATIASRATHKVFLAMMLAEVNQYHKTTFNVVLPRRALEIVAARAAGEMNDFGDDHYAKCLNILCRLRLYSLDFQQQAAQIVAEEQANKKSSEVEQETSVISNGLSEDGFD